MNACRQRLHEPLVGPIAVEQCARAEEEGDGRVDGGIGSTVPRDSQVRTVERRSICRRNREFEGTKGCRPRGIERGWTIRSP